MNETDSRYTDPQTFVDSLMADFGLLAAEAEWKAELEQLTDIDVPVVGSDEVDYGPIRDAEEALRDFAMYHLYADHQALDDLISGIDMARMILNGYQTPAGAPDVDTRPLGIDADITEITMGLASWRNRTADRFRDNFVSSIGPRKTNNVAAMDVSTSALRAAKEILVATREAAFTLVADAKSALEGYDPVVSGLVSGMELTLTGVSFGVGKVAGAAITVAEATLFQGEGMTVADLMRGFQTAIDEQRSKKDDIDGLFEELLAGALGRNLITWPSQVCSRPEPAGTGPDC